MTGRPTPGRSSVVRGPTAISCRAEDVLGPESNQVSVASETWRLDRHPPRWVLLQAREEHWSLGSSQRWRERFAQLGVLEVVPVHEGRRHGEHHLVAIECGGESQQIDWSHPRPLDEALGICLARLAGKRRMPGSFALDRSR